ncbi:hypothetical protein BTJ45_03252 [Bacillus mycoides]|nr:hypothetical protein BTJ45_03252 [Bacillus mycoides]
MLEEANLIFSKLIDRYALYDLHKKEVQSFSMLRFLTPH